MDRRHHLPINRTELWWLTVPEMDMSPAGLARLAQHGIDVPAHILLGDGTEYSGRTMPYPAYIDAIGLRVVAHQDRGHPAILHLRQVFVTPVEGDVVYEPHIEVPVACIASCAVSYRSYFPFSNN